MNTEDNTAILEAKKETLDSVVEGPVVTKIKETVNLEKGLHARPATDFTNLMKEYQGDIEMSFRLYDEEDRLYPKDKCEDARSIFCVLGCALDKNSEVYLKFTGKELSEEYKAKVHDVFNNPKYNKLLS